MGEINLELGQWVSCLKGYGQIMYIRAFYIEDYENDRQGRKNGDFIRYVYIIKVLCGFDGKIKKSNRLISDTSCNPIDKKGIELVKKIKTEQKEEYVKYVLYDEKNSLTKQVFLEFKLDTTDYNVDEINNQLTEIYFNLFPSFTYKEFAQEFKKYKFPFKLENLISYGGSPYPCVTLRLDSVLYKTKDKQTIFNDIRIRLPQLS